jgi:hypothetical protein
MSTPSSWAGRMVVSERDPTGRESLSWLQRLVIPAEREAAGIWLKFFAAGRFGGQCALR